MAIQTAGGIAAIRNSGKSRGAHTTPLPVTFNGTLIVGDNRGKKKRKQSRRTPVAQKKYKNLIWASGIPRFCLHDFTTIIGKKCLKNAISYFTSDLREKYLLANWVMVSFVWRNSSGQYGALTPALSDTFGMNWNANCKPNRLILYQYHQTSKCSFGWMSKNSYATYTRPVLPSE